MSSYSTTTPRKDGLTTEQAQARMGDLLQTYYIDDVDGAIDRGNRAPEEPAKRAAKPKQQPAKAKASSSKILPGSGSSQDDTSPPTRKSTRVRKRSAALISQDSEEIEQPPAKKAKRKSSIITSPNPIRSSGRPQKRKAEVALTAEESPPTKRVKIQMKGPKKVDKIDNALESTKTPEAPVQNESSDAEIEDASVETTKVSKAPAQIESSDADLGEASPNVPKVPATPAHIDSSDTDVEGAGETTETPTNEGKGNKGKGRGNAKSTAATTFKGQPSHMGYSTVKPDDAPNDEPWKCANRNCSSGQTWHNRDGPGASYGRKTISNFFGRNKKETNLIDPNVWHNYCRKDYQRSTYRANTQSAEAKCKYYIDNIQMQLTRIKLWRPDAQFKTQLSKGATDRLHKYNNAFKKNKGDKSKAEKAVEKSAAVNAKGKEKPLSLEDAIPIEYLEYFEEHFASDEQDQGFDDIKEILTWAQGLVDHGSITSMPPMEFLINEQQAGENVIDPTFNYERWAAYEDGKEFITPTASDAEEEDGDEADDTEDDDEATEAEADDAELEEDVETADEEANNPANDKVESESKTPTTPTQAQDDKRKRTEATDAEGEVAAQSSSKKRKRTEVEDNEDDNTMVAGPSSSKKQHLSVAEMCS